MKKTNEPSLSKPDFESTEAIKLFKKYKRMGWAHEYAENGIINEKDFIKILTPLQKEIAELKGRKDFYFNRVSEVAKERDALKEENERLKERLSAAKSLMDSYMVKLGASEMVINNLTILNDGLESELIRAKELLTVSRNAFVMLSLIDRSDLSNDMLIKIESFLREVK